MGLYTTHGAWHGPYSRFAAWRAHIASVVGITLDEMEGFGGKKKWLGSEPLIALLDHSDCDGHLTPHQCNKIAQRLREILPKVGEEWRARTEHFADGCAVAAAAGQNLEFH